MFVVVHTVYGQTDTNTTDYYNKNFIRYEDYVYKQTIKTVLLFKDGWEMSEPIIELNSDDKLHLSFDDLDADVKDYKYTVIHCDAFWQPSEVNVMDYIEGFDEDIINNYQFSFNTICKYTHYDLVFPADNMKITASGNYILKVFVDDNKENVVFTRRFMVYEEKVRIASTIKKATAIDDRDYKQEIDFTIITDGYQITNPFNDLKVVIKQNGRWDNAINNLKPKMVKDNELIYDYDYENVFSGGNEFRRFDIKSIRYKSEKVANIVFDTSGQNIYLLPDERKTFLTYQTDKDINGRKLIKSEDNVRDSDIEADYVYVHFFLPYNVPLVEGNIYVMGALTDWNFMDEAKMKYNYNPDNFGYEVALYLKQGYYNYQYIFLENGKNTGDESFIEGKHFETENDYTIYVYNRELGVLYDKLIGVKRLNSLTNNQ